MASSSSFVYEMKLDDVRTKRAYTLRQLGWLNVCVPDLQRAADLERVDDIVAYHASRPGPPRFIGDLLFAQSPDDATPLWIVDGQHRWLAMRRLAVAHPEALVSTEFVRLGAPSSPTLAELFDVVNRAVPVPQYIIDLTMDDGARRVMEGLADLVRAAHGPFLSTARNPHRPNINLSSFIDRVATSVAARQLHNATAVFEYMQWCNSRLRGRDAVNATRADTKASKTLCTPLYLTSDPDDAWVSNPELIRTFLMERARVQPQQPAAVDNNKNNNNNTNNNKGSLPLAARRAVWNAAFGEDVGKGACFCCGAGLTQHTYECGHIVPRSKGGTDTIDNLRAVCRSCNRSMGARNLLEFKATYFDYMRIAPVNMKSND